jgi:protease-4
MLRIFTACLGLLALLANGCAPATFSFTLFADNAKLHEVEVATDKGAPEPKVAIIDVRGLISDNLDGGLFGRGVNPVDEVAARLKKAREDSSVKAVILRINSPGGTVTASDMLYREVRRFTMETGKPVVSSLDEIAASGGYYLALSGAYIMAEPTSITGSIGVIIPSVNVSEGLTRIGIHSRSIVSGPNKDLANPLEPMREEQYAVLQSLVDDFYDRFRSLVVRRRTRAGTGIDAPDALGTLVSQSTRLDESRVGELTDGRIMSGDKAVRAGLVDRAGGLNDAFDAAKTLAGVKSARLVKYQREDADVPRTPYAASGVHPPDGTEVNLIQLRLNSGLPGAASSGGAYYLWLPPGM